MSTKIQKYVLNEHQNTKIWLTKSTIWCDAGKSDLSQPDKTSGLAGSADPADKSREEETEAECNHRVRPEHSTVHEPGDHIY